MLDRTTEMNTEVEIELTAGGLHEALRRVRHAMCREETRYYLDGVYLHHVAKVGALRFVATDGNRLATADIGTAEGAETIRPVILSRPFVVEALKGTGKRRDAIRHVRLAIGADYAHLTYWDGSFQLPLPNQFGGVLRRHLVGGPGLPPRGMPPIAIHDVPNVTPLKSQSHRSCPVCRARRSASCSNSDASSISASLTTASRTSLANRLHFCASA